MSGINKTPSCLATKIMKYALLLSLVSPTFLNSALAGERPVTERRARLDERRAFSGQGSMVYSVAFSPDGRRLASAGIDRLVIWDVASGEQQVTIEDPGRWFKAVVFSPDGKAIAAAGNGGKAAIFDAATGAIVWELPDVPEPALPGFVPAPPDPGPFTNFIGAVAWSPDGRTLTTGNSDGKVQVWDVETGLEKAAVIGHESGISAIAYSFDGRKLVTGSRDGTARLWDMAAPKPMDEPVLTLSMDMDREHGHVGKFLVVFSPDGTRLYSARNRVISEWDVESAERLRVVGIHPGGITALAIAADGAHLATSSVDDETVRVWELGNGRRCGVQRGLVHVPCTIAFAASDATLLATGASDALARVWRFQGSEDVIEEQAIDGLPFVLRQEVGDDHALHGWAADAAMQTFTAPYDGVIRQIDLRPNWYGGAKGTFLIREVAVDGAVLYEKAYEVDSVSGAPWQEFVLPAPVPVRKGRQYAWVLTGAHGLKHAMSDVYAGGCAEGGKGNIDYCFRIHFGPRPASPDVGH